MESKANVSLELINEAAESIYRSFRGGGALDRNMADRFSFEVEDGYIVQEKVTELKKDRGGEKVRGYKISLTSQETQNWFNALEPAYGTLTDLNISGGFLSMSEMSEPLVETELMFFVEKDIKGITDDQDLLDKVSVAAGIEIPDSRFSEWFPELSLGTIVADNAVAGRIVHGSYRKKLTYEELGDLDLQVFLNNEQIAKGHSSEVLGNPLESLKWLVRKLEGRGDHLRKGMVVSSGTFILPLKLKRGHYLASYSLLGDVELIVD